MITSARPRRVDRLVQLLDGVRVFTALECQWVAFPTFRLSEHRAKLNSGKHPASRERFPPRRQGGRRYEINPG